MLVGFEGGLGSGKTVGVVRYLYKDYITNHPIKASFNLYDIEYELLNIEQLLDKEKNEIPLNDVSMGIDELTVYVDCRVSTNKRNRLFSYFVLQTRKRNVTLYYTTQDFGMIDFRITNHTDIKILCTKLFEKDYPLLADYYGVDIEDNSILDVRHYSIMDLRNRRVPKVERKIIDMSPYYDYYDTDQKILPILE